MVSGDDEPGGKALLRTLAVGGKNYKDVGSHPRCVFIPAVMNVKGLLIDLDGTLYTGNVPIEGARKTLACLKDAGIPYRYVTNTTRQSRREIVARLDDMGFPVLEELVFTPATATNIKMRGHSCYPLVSETLFEDLGGLQFTSMSPEFVLVGDLGEDFTYVRLDAAFRQLMSGAELVALQKNRYWKKEDGLSLDAGPFVAALEYASGQVATVIGKPEPPFFRAALADLGLSAWEVAMVGDDARADVAGAQKAGLLGVQVKTGKYRVGIETPGAEPDLVLNSIAGLPEALGMQAGDKG
ncbi:MAG: TIGR01458 family HAD-type hydrolase [Rubrobacter sp.]|nr:TIGR01458 family HAD-type hydrolase [Rubrobacter sp.]